MNEKKGNVKQGSCVEVLRDLIDRAGRDKLIVTLAFFLGKSTTTIYAWGRIDNESKALEKLTHVGTLPMVNNSPKELVELVKIAKAAVSRAMGKGI